MGGDDTPNALRPIRVVISERIWKVYRRVHREGSAIQSDTPAEALHQLRIVCKKLRYLVTLFGSLYEVEDVQRLRAPLKALQDNLGDFNDLEVQQDHLRLFGHEMLEEGLGNAETFMAMGRLVQQLGFRQKQERRRFHTRFAGFSKKSNRSLFRRTFRS